MSGIDRIGRYRVERMLGAGAFASVWLAWDEILAAPVAVKVLADNWSRRLDVRERFLTEARLLRQADSDRVLRVLDIGELPDGRPYFVTSYADGGSLQDRLRSGGLSRAAALRILLDVAEAVGVLHQMGVVHRDLKPSNVLFQSVAGGGERVLVADLGLAKALAQGSGLTMAVGSPGYMAPEQARVAGTVDERCDVYGLGALGHRLLAGVTVGEPGGAEVPASLDRVLHRALQADPERRWSSTREFSDQLRAASESTQPGRVGRRRRWLLAAGGLAVLVAAGLLWWLVPVRTTSAAQVAESSCQPSDLHVSINNVGQVVEDQRLGLNLVLTAIGRACQLPGRLQDARLISPDGSGVPMDFVADVPEPAAVMLDQGSAAEVRISWVPGRAGDLTPQLLEFHPPGADRPISLGWAGGPIAAGSPARAGVLRPVTGEPSASPAAQPPSSTVTLGPEGYGPLRLGMTRKQALSTGALRDCVMPQTGGLCPELRDAPAGEGSVCISDTLGLAAIFAFPGLHTAEGIGVGASRAEVTRAYPNLTSGTHGMSTPTSQNPRAVYIIGFDGGGRVAELILALPDQDCFG